MLFWWLYPSDFILLILCHFEFSILSHWFNQMCKLLVVLFNLDQLKCLGVGLKTLCKPTHRVNYYVLGAVWWWAEACCLWTSWNGSRISQVWYSDTLGEFPRTQTWDTGTPTTTTSHKGKAREELNDMWSMILILFFVTKYNNLVFACMCIIGNFVE